MRIDLHADTPLWMHWLGYDFTKRHRAWLPGGALASQVDLPRMQEADLDAQMFGLVALVPEGDAFGTVNDMLDALEKAERASQGRFRLVRTGTDITRARAAGARVGLASLEGAHSLGESIERAASLIARGVVSFGLAHFSANGACYPARGLGRRDSAGLTAFGRDLVEYLAHRHVLLDLTHVNRAGFFEAIATSTGPLFVSHTGVAGVHRHWRNLDDTQIRAVADRGGVVGIIFSRHYLGGSGLSAVVAHLSHVVKVGGETVAALGSDFDGFVVPTRGLRDVTGLPALREALLGSGFSPRLTDAVMGENALAFLTRALG